MKQQSYLKKFEPQLHMPSSQSRNLSYSNSGMSSGDGYRLGNSSNNAYLKGSHSTLHGGGGIASHYQHIDGTNSSFPNYGISGYAMNSPLLSMISSHLGNGNMPPLFKNVAAASTMVGAGLDSRMIGEIFRLN